MNKVLFIAIFIFFVVIVAFAFYLYHGLGVTNQNALNYNPDNNLPIITSQKISPQKVSEGEISIKNFKFNPATLTIKVGTTVVWTNNDGMPHKIKSDKFNSDTLNKGQTFKFTFLSVGEYDYLCSIHPSMLGKVIVTQ